MKKFNLVMFILVIIGLQLPLYSSVINGNEVIGSVDIKNLIEINNSGNLSVGDLMGYLIVVTGVVFSVISILLSMTDNKKFSFISTILSVLIAIVGVVGLLYTGFMFFAYSGMEFNIKIGVYIQLIGYLGALTSSVLSIRVKE